MSLSNRVFEKVFSEMFVYNLLFEDSEVDCRYLRLRETDRVLSIAGAGCGVAGLLSFNPHSIHVVDRNLAHLSLSAIKMVAPRYLAYEDFYHLFGYGKHEESAKLLEAMTQYPNIPIAVKKHWRRNCRVFSKGLYESGLTTFTMQLLNRVCRVNHEWLEEIAELPAEDRVERVQHDVCRKLSHPLLKMVISSRLQMLSQGINLRQKKRLAHHPTSSVHDYFMTFLKRIVTTDVRKNWFIWIPLLKTFNHCDRQAIPPYLRESFYSKSARSRTILRWHHGNILDTLRRQENDYWSFVNCSDALDWMDDRSQWLALDLIYQKAIPGATVLLRSVEPRDLISSHGLDRRFRIVRGLSERASAEERSRLYTQVAFYRLSK